MLKIIIFVLGSDFVIVPGVDIKHLITVFTGNLKTLTPNITLV